MPQGWYLGAAGVRRDSTIFNMVMWHIKLTGMISRTEGTGGHRKFTPYGLTGDLGVRWKGQISFNFNYKVNFKELCQTLCVFSQIKDMKHIDQTPGWDFGVWGSKARALGFAMAPHQLHVLFLICNFVIFICSYSTYFIMPLTLKKLKGHIALGLSVRRSDQTKI